MCFKSLEDQTSLNVYTTAMNNLNICLQSLHLPITNVSLIIFSSFFFLHMASSSSLFVCLFLASSSPLSSSSSSAGRRRRLPALIR